MESNQRSKPLVPDSIILIFFRSNILLRLSREQQLLRSQTISLSGFLRIWFVPKITATKTCSPYVLFTSIGSSHILENENSLTREKTLSSYL